MDQNLAKIRHDRSVKDFPRLHLDDDEYIELVFGRAKNSLYLAWGGLAVVTVLILLLLLLLLISEIVADDMGVNLLMIVLVALVLADFIGGSIISKIHYGNKLFLTNKRLIQTIVTIPFLESERSINLDGINRVSYEQNSIIQRFLHFGNLQFSTHEKNVMILEDVAPKPAVEVLKDNSGAVYAFKNVEVSHEQLDEINQLISNAPKLGHKFTESITELNRS